MNEFISSLASEMTAMFDYREALGFSRKTHEATLLKFDFFCANNYPDAECLTKEMVMEWIGDQWSGIPEKAIAIRLFGKYLSAVGKESFILPHGFVSDRKTFAPYIFTDAELTSLFHAVDTIAAKKSEPFLPEIAPALFRLIYTCGLRPNEGRELKRENINFKNGEILITNTKRKKERIVVMSDDMLRLSKKYDERRVVFSKVSEYFFPSWSGGALTNYQVSLFFNECWKRANPMVDEANLPSVRVYDLRHRFASAALNRWLDGKQELGAKLPYLRAYMGHETLSETAHYIHLLPENLVKSAEIDWEAFDGLVPEVTLWQE
jgi:integrase